MARIRIPARLDEHLGKSSLATSVRLYVQRFDEWVGDDTKGLFFFPEYTDHGPEHVSSVLAGAEALILEDAWKAVTSEDVAVLITAALLHDSAMHLSADGFLALLDPARLAERPIIRPLDDKTWPELFEAFFAEARRWDQRKLHRILGDEATPAELEPDLIDYIKRPTDMPNPETWSVRYRKFLGEFIRRHHARLAHEIALSGFPGHQPNVLVPPSEFSKYADLAGLVARSHNMHLRDTFDYLEKKYYGRMTCRSTHPVFLMVLLRIADYLEIRSDRVNTTALQIQRLRSPISQEEQSSHLSIHEVRPDEHDDEAIFVIARPDSVRMFLKLQSLLKGLQAELDTSWAVLGEVYSRDRELRCFGIRLRRVRSNLDTPADFLRREEPAYFPIQAAFDTTGADLLKLLIKPLYGDRPEIGIRELLQNALDAVHELRHWARDHGDPAMEKIPLPQQEADVLISIDRNEAGEAWLTIRDKGIGMTVEVVRDYFLKAGASYRASTAWRQDFEDEKGSSKILRSGRFGVGALAAFLLGDRIIVSTRHVAARSSEGIRFSASFLDDLVVLERAQLATIGSTVQVKLSQRVLQKLDRESSKWDWYTGDDPKVHRFYFGALLKQHYHLPPSGGSAEVSFPGLSSIQWGFSRVGPGLACNGIIVRRRWDWDFKVPFDVPALSVVDPNGNLPLNLQRDGFVAGKMLFKEKILRDVICELCAFLVSWGPTSSDDLAGATTCLGSEGWPLLYNYHNVWPVFYAPEGFALLDVWSLQCLGRRPYLFYMAANREFVKKIKPQRGKVCGFLYDERLDVSRIIHSDIAGVPFRPSGVRVLGLGEDKRVLPYINEESLDAGWRITNFGNYSTFDRALSDMHDELRQEVLAGELKIIEFFPRVERLQTRFTDRLMRVLDSPVIPYDPIERRRQLPRAFKRIEKYMERWQPENLTGWRLKQVEWFIGGPVRDAASKPKKGRSRSRRS